MTWPTRQRWTYRIRESGPEYLAYRSNPILDWNPLEPNILKMVCDKWAEANGMLGRELNSQAITFDYREKVGTDGLPLPDLADVERGLIWTLMSMDTDRDGVVVASMDDVQARIKERGERL